MEIFTTLIYRMLKKEDFNVMLLETKSHCYRN